MAERSESQHLARIASDSWYGRGANAKMVEYSHEIFLRHFRSGTILELGPAEGIMTELLARGRHALTVVDGAASFCEALRRKYPAIEVVHSLFEDFRPSQQYANIIMGHVLEHVADPVDILHHAKSWLAPGGRIMAAVPNSRSLHRQAAVLMGLLPFEEHLNDADVHHGHRRVFNPETFRRAFTEAGLKIELFGGYWLKPVSNAQIEQTWSAEMLQAFMQLGERYPDIAGELYIVAC